MRLGVMTLISVFALVACGPTGRLGSPSAEPSVQPPAAPSTPAAGPSPAHPGPKTEASAPKETTAGAAKPLGATSTSAGKAKRRNDSMTVASEAKGLFGAEILDPIRCPKGSFVVRRNVEATPILVPRDRLRYEGCLGQNARGEVVPTDRWKFYHRNGTLRAHLAFHLGVRHGDWQAWSESGEPVVRARFRDGVLHGEAYLWRWKEPRNTILLRAGFESGVLVHAEGESNDRHDPHGRWRVSQKEGAILLTMWDSEGTESIFHFVNEVLCPEAGGNVDFLRSLDHEMLIRFTLRSGWTKWLTTKTGEPYLDFPGSTIDDRPVSSPSSYANAGWQLRRYLDLRSEKAFLAADHVEGWVRSDTRPFALVEEFLKGLPSIIEESVLEVFPVLDR